MDDFCRIEIEASTGRIETKCKGDSELAIIALVYASARTLQDCRRACTTNQQLAKAFGEILLAKLDELNPPASSKAPS